MLHKWLWLLVDELMKEEQDLKISLQFTQKEGGWIES